MPKRHLIPRRQAMPKRWVTAKAYVVNETDGTNGIADF